MKSTVETKIIELVKSGHERAADLKASCGAVDVRSLAQLISDLASQLEVQFARSNALAAENANARNAVQVFCDIVGANTDDICEVVGQDGVKAILAAMSATGKMPATDAFLAEVRAQGVEMLLDVYRSRWISPHVEDADRFAAQLRKGAAQ